QAVFTGDHERVRPAPGAVAGDLAGDPRIGPMRPVTRDVEQPDQSVGRLPNHRVAERVKRVACDRLRRRPSGSVSHESRAENGPAVVVVFTVATEENQIKIAVVQLVKAGRMLVVARLYFRAQDALDFDLIRREQFTEERNRQPQGNEAKCSAEMAVAVHAMRHLTPCAASLQVRIQASVAWLRG